jgi:hypothetical protein
MDANTIVDGKRIRTNKDYLYAVTREVHEASRIGTRDKVNPLEDIQDWLSEGDFSEGLTISELADEWDGLFS